MESTASKNLLEIVENLAETDPTGLWASIPVSESSYNQGYRDISYRELSNGVDGAAAWLLKNLGPGQNFETLAYFGKWDPRYILFILGAVKAGYKMATPTGWLTADGLKRLLVDRLHCRTIITSDPPAPIVLDFVKTHPVQTLHCPSYHELAFGIHPRIAFNKSFAEAANEPLCVLNTTGTTGDPKPMVWTHGWAASYIRQSLLPPPEGFESVDRGMQGVRLVSMVPPFACGNLYVNMLAALGTGSKVIYPTADAPITPDTLLKTLEHIPADVAICGSRLCEALASNPQVLAKVARRLKSIGYAGGSVSQATGEAISKHLKLFCIYASTENGVFPTLRPQGPWNPKRWRYVHFHPQAGVELRSIGGAGLEAVVTSRDATNGDPASLSPALHLFSNQSEWHTRDIFVPTSDEPGAWLYRSRLEDIIELENGTTLNPQPYQTYMEACEEIAGALLFVRHCNEGLLLVEPSSRWQQTKESQANLVERLWPRMVQANQSATQSVYVPKAGVVFTTPNKPLPRTPFKDLIKRTAASALYAAEIEKGWARVDESKRAKQGYKPAVASL